MMHSVWKRILMKMIPMRFVTAVNTTTLKWVQFILGRDIITLQQADLYPEILLQEEDLIRLALISTLIAEITLSDLSIRVGI